MTCAMDQHYIQVLTQCVTYWRREVDVTSDETKDGLSSIVILIDKHVYQFLQLIVGRVLRIAGHVNHCQAIAIESFADSLVHFGDIQSTGELESITTFWMFVGNEVANDFSQTGGVVDES